MATIDEVLAAMPAEAAQAFEYLTIDPASRSITVPDAERIFGVESDEDAARKYFLCPRYVGDGLDLASMFLTVNYRNANGDEDGYLVEDVAIAGENITFSWLLSEKVTAYKGAVQFSVCADLPATAGRKRPDWNTTLAAGEVLEGLDPDRGDVEGETSEVVTQLRAEVTAQTAAVEACGAAQVAAVKAQGTNTTQEAVAAIQAQGEATKASLPADYTALAGTVNRLTRDRAAAIVCEAAGAAIQVADASNDPLQGLRIFGKSTQDGTPTPDNPVEIVSTPAPVVGVYGKNLVAYPYYDGTITRNGVTFTDNGDGSVDVAGTCAAAGTWWSANYQRGLPKGVYTLSCVFDGIGEDSGLYAYMTDRDTSKTLAIAKPSKPQVTFTVTEDLKNASVSLAIPGAETIGGTVKIQLEKGPAATEYTPPQTTHLLTITTPGSLPGIPVASGGNYTDANGQQWIADEVDLARGVYVQRVGVETKAITFNSIDTSERFIAQGVFDCCYKGGGSPCICNVAKWYAFGMMEKTCCVGARTLYYKNTSLTIDEANALFSGIELQIAGVLAYPIETPLSDAELQAFLAMHSNKPTTTVLNDAGAHMVLEYAADPKTYIDNKLAALVAANS